MDTITRTVYGFVTQRFSSEGRFLGQDFTAGDEEEWRDMNNEPCGEDDYGIDTPPLAMVENFVQCFLPGDMVTVTPKPGDLFNQEFVATVYCRRGHLVTVTDQEENAWDCDPDQITRNK